MHLKDLPFQPMGGQPAFTPDALERFVAAPRIGVLAYTKRDGTPAQAPIWYTYEDGRFYMITSATSPKAKALARAGKACMTIQDEVPPYRAAIIDGDVELREAPLEGGRTDGIAVRYFGRYGAAEYRKMTAEENAKTGLSLIVFEPTRVRGFDNHRLLSVPLRVFMRVRDALPIPREWI